MAVSATSSTPNAGVVQTAMPEKLILVLSCACILGMITIIYVRSVGLEFGIENIIHTHI